MIQTRKKFLMNYILRTTMLLEYNNVRIKKMIDEKLNSKNNFENKKKRYNIEVSYNGNKLSQEEVDNILKIDSVV